ncbi:hypothetical protein MRX96_046266 [Rhipicephalus microplus]
MRGLCFPLLIGYVYFVKIAGPRWMKDRKPFNLRWAVLTYNALTVLANAYFAVKLFGLTYASGHYSLFCQGINYSSPTETDMAILKLGWWYSFVRIGDFLDTIFFVLRKKNSQITFLHVAHHFLVVFSAWFYMNFGGDGQTALGGCVNASIHVIMYSYYFLAALGPSSAEVPVVEALPDQAADCPVRGPHVAHDDHAFLRLRIPEATRAAGAVAGPPGPGVIHQLLRAELRQA